MKHTHKQIDLLMSKLYRQVAAFPVRFKSVAVLSFYKVLIYFRTCPISPPPHVSCAVKTDLGEKRTNILSADEGGEEQTERQGWGNQLCVEGDQIVGS